MKIECMQYIQRTVEKTIRAALARNKSVLLLGARQTGKTTLLSRFKGDFSLNFVRPQERQRYEQRPELLTGEIEALASGRKKPILVLLDEIQRVPQLLDVVQDLIDRNVARFVLTGSSARKLRRHYAANLLPGRVVVAHIEPLSIEEYPQQPLSERLLYGSLPGIAVMADARHKEEDLRSYVVTYLEEEVRAEALVRRMGPFSRFLEMAALESGKIINTRKISQDIGVAHTTVAAYYELLEDCLIAKRFDPLTQSRTRTRLIKSPKYVIFDLGLRRSCAHEPPVLHPTLCGDLFEQWVGLELFKYAEVSSRPFSVKFWRDPAGPEVDWVLDHHGEYVPVEVKWTQAPSLKDAKSIHVFLKEYKNSSHGYIVCRTPRAVKLTDRILAVPWQDLGRVATGKKFISSAA
ncbi:MAG: ATP-binding protein [Candidatus Omnitrophica bacterium]|nr:ATP-binding protein [Candidatus Omnitrophota bacterium]